MHVTVYGRGKMVIPAKVRKQARVNQGDVLEVLPEGDGCILLVRLERPRQPGATRVKLRYRKGRHAVIEGGPRIASEQVKRLLNDSFA